MPFAVIVCYIGNIKVIVDLLNETHKERSTVTVSILYVLRHLSLTLFSFKDDRRCSMIIEVVRSCSMKLFQSCPRNI
jgi:hypothetical protein